MKRGRSLTGLAQKKITTGLKRLQEAGITSDLWLTMLNANTGIMQKLVAAWPMPLPSFAYDAVDILGFGQKDARPLPRPAFGEIVIRVGDWSLQDLRESVAGKRFMNQEYWYEQYPFCSAKLTPGIYCMRLPVPESNRNMSFVQQGRLLTSNENVAPVTLAASVLLVHLKVTGSSLLNKTCHCRCAELLLNSGRVTIGASGSRVKIDVDWDDLCNDCLWLAAARRC